MTESDKAVMQMALDWVNDQGKAVFASGGMNAVDRLNEVSKALTVAIAQPEQTEAQEQRTEAEIVELAYTVSGSRYYPDQSGKVAFRYDQLQAFASAIAQPTQARMLRNLVATMLTKKPIEQPEPVSQPLTHKEIQAIWEIWESQVFPIIDLEAVHPPIAQPAPVLQPLTDQDAKDAARYRFLKAEAYECVVPHGQKINGSREGWITKIHPGKDFDTSIDAAIAQPKDKP